MPATGDLKFGVDIIAEAIQEPLRPRNAGGEPGVIVEKVREGDAAYGYNARKDSFEDLFETGIIDQPVTRSALQNAASVVGLLLTTEALVADSSEEDDAH